MFKLSTYEPGVAGVTLIVFGNYESRIPAVKSVILVMHATEEVWTEVSTGSFQIFAVNGLRNEQ